MPNMFSRRRGSSATRSVDTNTSAAATTAASSAFLSRATSQGSLSSAAAAAALTSRPTTPTAVGNIQTKRMVRRGSNSSVGSSSVIGSGTRGGVGRAGLQRRDSGGSMTERTFRSPSPGRPDSAASAAPDAPPVPKLPAGVRGGTHQRSASQQPPQRVLSPSPRGSRGVSVDRAPSADRLSKRLSNVLESEEGNSSVNFSRPMASTNTSPSTQKSGGSWFTGASGKTDMSNLRPAKGAATSNSMAAQENATASKPVKKKQSLQNTQGVDVTRANTQPSAEAVDTLDTIMVYDPSSRTFIAKPRPVDQKPEPPSPLLPKGPAPKPGTYDPNTRSIVPEPQPAKQPARRTTSTGDLASDPSTAPKKKKPTSLAVNTEPAPPPRNPARASPSATDSPSSPRAAGLLSKQPSVVREDPREEEEEATSFFQPSPSPQKKRIQTSAGPALPYTPHNRNVSLDVPRSGSDSSRGRGGSISPSRNAHFSATPVVEGTRHVPHRGVSPVKSAMKHSPSSSVRTASPNTATSPLGARAASESSEAPSLGPVEGVGVAGRKKKSVRVSFDAQPHEIPSADETPKRAGGGVGRERSPALEDDMEELMKPRPALPSFGSVRKSSGRQAEVVEKVTERPPERDRGEGGFSGDQVVGGVFAQHAAESERDGGTGQEEPLPPEVTSKDAPSYASDSSSEDELAPPAPITPTETGKAAHLDDKPTQTAEKADATTNTPEKLAAEEPKIVSQTVESKVPELSFQPPTPGAEEEEEIKLGDATAVEPAPAPEVKTRKERQFFNVPGSWGEPDDEDDEEPTPADPTSAVAAPTSAAKPFETHAEPEAPAPVLQPSPLEPGSETGVLQLSDISESDSDDSAAFSDAAEEQSDLEGGFASLNAILESPSPAAKAKPSTNTADGSPQQKAKSSADSDKKSPDGDWSQATAYWARLSRQQREQIEREHFSSDDEARPAPIAKPKRKKSGGKKPQTGAGGGPEQPALRKSMRGPPPPQEEKKEEKVHMRSSMRGPPAQAQSPAAQEERVHMRSSMRDNGSSSGPGAAGGGMRSSMRGPPQPRPQSEYGASSRNTSDPAARPKSAGNALQAGAAGSAMARRRRDSEESAQSSQPSPFPTLGNKKAAQPPPPSSRLSKQAPTAAGKDDSDSESSFKKARRGRRPSNDSAGQGGKYTMKRSMRAGSLDSGQPPHFAPQGQAPGTPTPKGKGRSSWSVRSMSPTGSLFGRRRDVREEIANSGGAGAKTMRGSNGMGKPEGKTLRGSGGAPKPAPAAIGGRFNFKSKFAQDSDDEDDAGGRGRARFSSRFADSDDSGDEQQHLAPVRGIPRRKGQEDGDSTELSDEEDEDPRKASRRREKGARPGVPDPVDVEKAMAAARRNLGMTNGATTTATVTQSAGNVKEGTALGRGSLRPQEVEPERPMSPGPDSTPKRRGFMGSILRRNRGSSMSVQQVPHSPAIADDRPMSPAPRGKLTRRASAQHSSPAPAPLSKLRPSALDGGEGGDWPLLSPAYAKSGTGGVRPSTSDGTTHEQAVRLARTMRPEVGERVRSYQGESRGGGREGKVARFADEERNEAGDGGGGKGRGRKKRFGMLRRAFRLDD